MKITDYRWIGMLVHDFEATCDFYENTLELELMWHDKRNQVAMYKFPSGQEFEVYAPGNRNRDPKYNYYNGPVIGLTVEDIGAAREELTRNGARFVDEIEQLKDGSVKWTHFWGPDGQFYSLQQYARKSL